MDVSSSTPQEIQEQDLESLRREVSPVGRLHILLCDSYGPAQLRRFVQYQYGDKIWRELPGENVSYAELVAETISILHRYLLINYEFFRALVIERPARAKEIRDCAKLWGFILREEPEAGEKSKAQESKKEPLFSMEIKFRGRRIYFGISAVALGMVLEPTRPEPPGPLSIVLQDVPSVRAMPGLDVTFAYGKPPYPFLIPNGLRLPEKRLLEEELAVCKGIASDYGEIGTRIVSFNNVWYFDGIPLSAPFEEEVFVRLVDCLSEKLRGIQHIQGLHFWAVFRDFGEVLEIQNFGVIPEESMDPDVFKD